MTGPSLLLLCLWAVAPATAPATAPVTAPTPVYRDAATLTVEGLGFDDREQPFDRLPATAKHSVPSAVWTLSRDSAGVVVRFVTTSRSLHVRGTLARDTLHLPHMPASGASGLDLYTRSAGAGEWRWTGIAIPKQPTFDLPIATDLPPGEFECLLYLPLYNGVRSLEIGIEPAATLEALPPRQQRPIVFYGTSITQGASASRPGLAHVAQLGRRLDVPVINLGFSGSGRMERSLAEQVATIDAAVFVIDCLPNMDATLVRERAGEFLDVLRAERPTTPVLLVESPNYPRLGTNEPMRGRVLATRSALRELHAARVAAGDRHLHHLAGDRLYGDDAEATVDGIHPNDLGFTRLADAFAPILRALLP